MFSKPFNLRDTGSEKIESLKKAARVLFHFKLNKKKAVIRKLKSGEYRIYSRSKDPKTNKRKNLGTFSSREAARKHERAIQYFKHH